MIWIRSLFRWCPTSTQLLREAEKNILRNLKCSYRGQYVNIGKAVGSKDNEIWTVIANEESEKTPLVMIHGFGSGSALWCLNFDSLATYRPVYAFDIIGKNRFFTSNLNGIVLICLNKHKKVQDHYLVIGFGRSSRPTFNSEALEAEGEFINSIEAWRSSLNLEKFILLGHSFGGFLAASYAIKHPDRISHLILADPWGFPERPLDVAERYNLPLWVKAVGAIVQPFNPLFLLRTAGPLGYSSWFLNILGPKIVQKVRPDLIRKFSGLVKDADEVIPNYLYHCNAQNPSAVPSPELGFGELGIANSSKP
ncbi:1-acylglycerol-3-phosphate O-acyltransferase ABHD5 [Armadillidium nasatum]|uniref:1-acylglycerol-3-phosphate O-acyltransferase ABHD5 n=1 Tax=Armadillidium nasatum TaxID=96803 RepID=A0A5N5TFT6_9CRUS|nr:1-acylglycerol-3-phosphate O-acyltransferase ABHD5 [Armadillidium nasatum]